MTILIIISFDNKEKGVHIVTLDIYLGLEKVLPYLPLKMVFWFKIWNSLRISFAAYFFKLNIFCPLKAYKTNDYIMEK